MNILQLYSCIALLIFVLHSIKASDDVEDWENTLEDFDEETKNSGRYGRLSWLFEGIKKDEVGKRCTGPNGQRGTCVSSFSCKIKDGLRLSPSNGCTSGVCCQTIAKCGQTSEDGSCLITQNGAAITQNTGSGTNRVYKIPKVKGVCQVKLEIDLFDLGEEIAGDCAMESMTVLGSSTVSSLEICGNNTGQHMYLEYGCASHISILIKLFEGSRSTYSIRPYYIKCSSPKRVPAYCLKYLTGISGRDRSFNNNRGQLNNQNYKVCVAPVEGLNSITVICLKPLGKNAGIQTPNHIFWQTSDPCGWWNSPESHDDPLREAVRMDSGTSIICEAGSVPIIDYDMLLSLPNLPMDLVTELWNLDTANTGFCLEYSQPQ